MVYYVNQCIHKRSSMNDGPRGILLTLASQFKNNISLKTMKKCNEKAPTSNCISTR